MNLHLQATEVISWVLVMHQCHPRQIATSALAAQQAVTSTEGDYLSPNSALEWVEDDSGADLRRLRYGV